MTLAAIARQAEQPVAEQPSVVSQSSEPQTAGADIDIADLTERVYRLILRDILLTQERNW